MAPKTLKKTPVGPGMKKRGPKSTTLKAHDTIKVDQVNDDLKIESLSVEGDNIGSGKKELERRESINDYVGGERLDLEDNDPEYEPEEYGGVDYEEKDIEHEYTPEVDLVEEDPEGEDVVEEEEEEDDSVDEEDDVHEDIEGGEYDMQAREGHADMTDAEGCAEEDHHDVVKERRKRKEFEIFIGGLDKDATEEDLRNVFSQVGEVTEIRLMMNPQTNKNKGFAFLRFATVNQAKRACTEMKNPMVNGKQCGVTPSHDSDTLFIGNICKTWTKEALEDKLKHCGIENVDDLTLVEDINDPGMNRGFAFLEFSSRADAMDAVKLLQKRDLFLGGDKPAKVSFADSFIDPGDEIMAQVKTVFVDGVSPSWDEDRVRDLLKQYGHIEKVELARNMPSARRKNFGFVTFDSHDAAINCAKNINNEELGEGDQKARVRARLSRPLQRGKGKHASRGDLHSSRRSMRSVRNPWAKPPPRSLPIHRSSGIGVRAPPLKRPATSRDRRAVLAPPRRSRPAPPPSRRSYDRRPPPVPSYTRSRDYGRREERAPRTRPLADYSRRAPADRHTSYRDIDSRGSDYAETPRASRPAARRAYDDDSYEQRYERLPPTYRVGRGSDYDSLAGSKRPYPPLDDVPQRYDEAEVRHSRARSDYELSSRAAQYADAYGDSSRFGRSSLGGYSSSRSSVPGHDSHDMYSSRLGASYSGGSLSSSDVGRMYSSSGYSGNYMSRGSDIGGSSYSSIYSGRALDGSSYMGSSGSGSYYQSSARRSSGVYLQLCYGTDKSCQRVAVRWDCLKLVQLHANKI
ncbi:RNA metabolism protein [Lithospermum erythrorhizon]|uniref:RNA metabolism protein n=1 Tax=Lithospermum erythrorhizon TaxID=34254 RepID=A0AAV3RDX4_LITER